MQGLLNLKTLIIDAILRIGFVEIGIFMLGFLMFILVVFIAIMFWHHRMVFLITFVLEVCFLAGIPFGMAFVLRHYIFPIEISSSNLNPLTYTTGFSFNLNFKNKSKHTIKECVFSVSALRDNKGIIGKVSDLILPLNASVSSIKLELKPQESYEWSGIIDGYDYPNNRYKTALDCH